jgi:hypothetical protein
MRQGLLVPGRPERSRPSYKYLVAIFLHNILMQDVSL